MPFLGPLGFGRLATPNSNCVRMGRLNMAELRAKQTSAFLPSIFLPKIVCEIDTKQ